MMKLTTIISGHVCQFSDVSLLYGQCPIFKESVISEAAINNDDIENNNIVIINSRYIKHNSYEIHGLAPFANT